jgi:nucleotide-binding universal stress UspA family protein
MIGITLLITLFALPQVRGYELPQRIGTVSGGPGTQWLHFVAIVLALSGVEAIGNLTGVMKKPVAATARRSIWVVAIEVALFNVLLGICMVARLTPEQRDAHKEDMLAFLSLSYIGPWAEICVRVVGGLLLLSAVNTVITDMISVQYLLSRDGELPQSFQKLNRFGVPWIPAIIATAVPVLVLVVSHDLEHLAALYAIGVVGAVSINITLVSTHPRLRSLLRKVCALLLGLFLIAIWVTLAFTKLHALAFVTIVLAVGLTARLLTRLLARRNPKPSLLRQAIYEQLPTDAMTGPKLLVGTYGAVELAEAALEECRRSGASLVVCFVRQVSLSYKYDSSERRLSMETDLGAMKTFARFLELGHAAGVPVVPVYDTGPDAAELLAEHAAILGCDAVLIGTTRRGALYHLIKGTFQRRLESLLPKEVPVRVIIPVASRTGSEEPAGSGVS